MFQHLTQLGFKRSGKQAIGFYIAHFLLLLLVAGIAGAVFALATGAGDFETGARIGNIIAIFYCLGMAASIVQSKKLFSSFKAVILIVLAGVGAVFLGALLGLLPVAYLTTLGNDEEKPAESDSQTF